MTKEIAAKGNTLPTNHLPPALAAPLMSAMDSAAFSIAEARKLLSLPVPMIRKELMKKQADLGEPLTRRESDEVMRNLALVLPRSNPGDVDRMLDLYFGFLREAGMTGKILQMAAKRFVMMPNGVKAKFFPDPGQLAEIVSEEIRDRARALRAVQNSIAVLESPPPAPPPKLATQEFIRKMLAKVGIDVDKRGTERAIQRAAEHREFLSRKPPDPKAVLTGRDPAAVARLNELREKKAPA